MLAGYDHLLAAARRLQWDAEAIDLGADRIDPGAADAATLRELIAGFLVAERAVAAELDPWIAAAGAPAAAECFAVQQRDERRHARFFERVAAEVPGAGPGAAPPAVRTLFTETLPAAARALAADAATIAAAVGLYHLVIEGIVFAVGQEALLELATTHGLAGVAEGVARVQADERWHVGLGVLHLQRLGLDPAVTTASAERALAGWGPAIATPARVERARAVHTRRLRIAIESRP